jgi:FkbM family methyltransferase
MENGVRFEFPSSDYYWARLLDTHFKYEPEIDCLLKIVRENNWVFIDLGANFGYWTVRVAAGLYGAHRVVAVEPSDYAFGILRSNVDAYRTNVSLYRVAVDEENGRQVELYGARHAGISTNRNWNGGVQPFVGTAKTTTVDALLFDENIDARATSVLIKLDIEGAELKALRGAVHALAGRTAILLEDQECGDVSDATKFCFASGMNLYYLSQKGPVEVSSQLEIQAKRGFMHRMQARPILILATASPIWLGALRMARPRSLS